MSYFLKAITSNDINKIIDDFHSSNVKDDLIFAKNSNCFPDSWAINLSKNFYLFPEPIPIRPENMDRNYCFFANKKIYIFTLEYSFDNILNFSKIDFCNEQEYSFICNEINAALITYGLWGKGSIDENGIRTWNIHTNFSPRRIS